MATKKDPLQSLINRWLTSIDALGKKRNQEGFVMGDLSEWEEHSDVFKDEAPDENDIEMKKNPEMKDRLLRRLEDHLHSLPIVFISENAYHSMCRLQEALDMVGMDHWTDCIAMTSTRHCYEYQLIFEAELKFCADLLKNRKYDLAVDSLISILMAFRHNSNGFRDYDNEPQHILHRFGSLWKRIMGSDVVNRMNQKRTLLPSGYVREFAVKMKVEIPLKITLLVQKWMGSPLDIHTKRVLYDEMKDLNEDFERFGFGLSIPFGEYPADIDGVGHEKVEILSAAVIEKLKLSESFRKQPKWTMEQLVSKNVEELRTICRDQDRCAIDPEATEQKDLLEYLLYPDNYVVNMKRKYHYDVMCKREGGLFHKDMTQKEINMWFCRFHQFDDRKYVVRDGIVAQRMAYSYEVQGKEVPDYLRNGHGEEIAIRLEKERKMNSREKKRKRQVQAERVRAAKKRKTCEETCELEWDDLRQSKGQKGCKRHDLVEEAKTHCIAYSGTKEVIAKRLLKHYQDWHSVDSD